MRYTLRRVVLGEPRFIELSEDEFTAIKAAQEKLFVVLDIEATFDLLLENSAEFEREFLDFGLRLSRFGEHGEPLGPYRETNHRLTSLLSSIRLYLDQIPQNLTSLYGKDSEHADIFKQCRRKQYDSSRAYRAMEALRNHAQHHGFPVHAITSGLEPEDTNHGSLLRAGLHPYVDVQRLRDNPTFGCP